MDMLRDRNLIANTYKESTAKEIYENIKKLHIKTLEEFVNKFNHKITF